MSKPRRKPATLVSLLKKYTDIDHSFIEDFIVDFRAPFDEEEEVSFPILDEKAAAYLGITLKTLRKRLQNAYSDKKIYYQFVDFIRARKSLSSREIFYKLSYSCFERLAMNGDTEKAETVRLYFSKIRQFLTNHADVIKQALDNQEHILKALQQSHI